MYAARNKQSSVSREDRFSATNWCHTKRRLVCFVRRVSTYIDIFVLWYAWARRCDNIFCLSDTLLQAGFQVGRIDVSCCRRLPWMRVHSIHSKGRTPAHFHALKKSVIFDLLVPLSRYGTCRREQSVGRWLVCADVRAGDEPNRFQDGGHTLSFQGRACQRCSIGGTYILL